MVGDVGGLVAGRLRVVGGGVRGGRRQEHLLLLDAVVRGRTPEGRPPGRRVDGACAAVAAAAGAPTPPPRAGRGAEAVQPALDDGGRRRPGRRRGVGARRQEDGRMEVATPAVGGGETACSRRGDDVRVEGFVVSKELVDRAETDRH